MTGNDLTLFGSEKRPWTSKDWTDSDDRVRGGKSQSYLKCTDKHARFYGNLDIKTLGGAGFASQRTTTEDSWDLSDYAGIQLNIAKGDKKRYTFTIKDELLPPDEKTGREQSTISYECDFDLPRQDEPDEATNRSIFIPWKSLTPTFRGRVKKDAKPLDKKNIKRFSLMMRSFFGTQEGDFSLTITSIKALEKVPEKSYIMQPMLEEAQLETGSTEDAEDNRYSRLQIDLHIVKLDIKIHRRQAILLGSALCVVALCYLTLTSKDR